MPNIFNNNKILSRQLNSNHVSEEHKNLIKNTIYNLSDTIKTTIDHINFEGLELDNVTYVPNQLEFEIYNKSQRAKGFLHFSEPLVDGDIINFEIHGYEVTFTAKSSDNMSSGIVELNINIDEYKTVSTQMLQLHKMIMNIINYDGIDNDLLNVKAALSAVEIEHAEGKSIMSIEARSAGVEEDTIRVSTNDESNKIFLNGVNVDHSGLTFEVSNQNNEKSNFPVGMNNHLHGGTFATCGASPYSGTATTIAQGFSGDSIITAIDNDAAAYGAGDATGVSSAGISNNPDFIGVLQGFEVEYWDYERVNIELTIGNFTYRANNVDTTPESETIVRLSSIEGGGGFFDLQLTNHFDSGISAIKNHNDAEIYAERLNKAFENVTFYQNREIDNFISSGTVFPTASTLASGDLSGSSFHLISDDFEDLQIKKFLLELL